MSATLSNAVFSGANVASAMISSFTNSMGQVTVGANYNANALMVSGDPTNGYSLSVQQNTGDPFIPAGNLINGSNPFVIDNPNQIVLARPDTPFFPGGAPSSGAGYVFSNVPITPGQTFTFTAGQGDFTYNPSAAACFASGTRIRTARGEVAVEDLVVGDEAVLASGEREPIVWIGHRRTDCVRHPDPRLVRPVRVTAGVFGPGLPARDLWLSPDHAIFVEGVLIPAKALVNETTIAQVGVPEVTYWHIELATHDVLLAEGLPCESYLDTANRDAFENGGEVVSLNPDFWSVTADARRCAPLCVDGPEVERVRFLLRVRTEAPKAAA